ncbi:MAG TPA: gamma-glutamyl-gamma-aminobutyrate hydrolase family protein, partial [Bryobacteraceae bacterium]|nr:gamma-glutamyl-gamma-aminobutyrate hydrolase family protein [Bryobacteraceae bacterium]
MNASGIRTLIIDNYDSFTFNLYQLIGRVNGEEPVVVRNDQFTWAELARLAFDNIVISPGPGTPARREDFGICAEAILHAQTPLLGVCLGHQGLGLAYGARLQHASEPVHGRLSAITHDRSRLFAGIPQGFHVVRYHSLTLSPDLPSCLRPTAWTADGILMALAHRELPRFGIQFHPESICSEYGDLLLKNFRDLTPRPRRVSFAAAARRATVVPHPSARRRTSPAHKVHSRKIAFDPAGAARAFEVLYGAETHAFWLDSSRAEPGLSRFSFMGAATAVVTYDHRTREVCIDRSGHRHTTRQNICDYLSDELARRRCDSDELPFDFNGGFVGYFGYELKAGTGAGGKHRSPHPDAAFLMADRFIAFDHEQSAAWLISHGDPGDAEAWIENTAARLLNLPPEEEHTPSEAEDLTFRLTRDRDAYLAAIARCQQYIRDGESYEICLTNRIHTNPIRDPLRFYLTLRRVNPAPYAAF